MRHALALAALAALGCDDPAVGAKALDVLEHGFVAAQIRCSCSIVSDGVPYGVNYSAQRLLDGACLVSSAASQPAGTILWARSEANAVDCRRNDVYLLDGDIHLVIPTGDGPRDLSEEIATCCTGFNLEAFGVE